MNDSNLPNQPVSSYVDNYQPPAPVADPNASQPQMASAGSDNQSAPTAGNWPWSSPAAPNNEPVTPVTAAPTTVATPAAPASPAPSPIATDSSAQSQALEDQNIFFLLGVEDGSDQEKEAFLDELQQVIWEDFLENDVQLLITAEEQTELQQIMAKSFPNEEDKQEEIVVYLEKLIPDLEEVMLEKALELKEDMVRERVSGLQEYLANKPAKLQQLSRVETLIKEGKWYDAAQLMNELAA